MKKKLFSFLLAVSIMPTAALCVPVAAEETTSADSKKPDGIMSTVKEDYDFTVLASSAADDFTDITYSSEPVTNEDGTTADAPLASIDTETYADNPLYKNTLRLSGSTTTGPNLTYSFDAITANEPNVYVETEFDIITSNLATVGTGLTFTFGGTGIEFYTATKTGIMYQRANNERKQEAADIPDAEEWTKYRFVMQLTDKNGKSVNKMVGIYANGESIMRNPLSSDLDFLSPNPAYESLQISINPKPKTNYGLWVDNISVKKYTSNDKSSPVPDKSALAKDITELYIILERNKFEITQKEYNSYKETIDSLVEVYNYTYASREDVKQADDVVKTLLSQLDCASVVELFSEDFEGESALMEGTVKNDGAYAVKNALALTSSAQAILNKGTDLFKTFYGPETIVVTEFDVKTENFNENADAQMLVKLMDSNTDTDLTRIKLDTNSINMTGRYGVTDTSLYNRYSSLIDGKWYTIRLVTRITDSEGGAWSKNTKLYINGNNFITLTKTAIGKVGDTHGHELLTTEGVYDKLLFEVSEGTAYIDNVKVTRCYGYDNEPVNYGQLLTTIRKGDDKVARVGENVVTEEIMSTFNTALNSAKTVYENKADLPTVEVENDALCRAYADFKFKNESVKIGSVNFKDKEGNDTPYLTNGGKIAGVNVTKLAQYSASCDLLVALYNPEGMLEAVNYLPKAFAQAQVDVRTTIPVDITLPEDVTNYTVKVFAFDANEDMSLLCDVHTPSNAPTTLHIAGTSMVQTYDIEGDWPRQGWGYYAADFYDNTTLNNCALSGQTTASLVDRQFVEKIESVIKPGDYLIASFIGNDEKHGPTRPQHVTAYDYKNNLRHYAEIAEENGAHIIYVNACPRLTKNNADCYDGGYADETGLKNYYITLIDEVAAELDAPIIDIYSRRKAFQDEKGYDYVHSAMYLSCTDTLALNFPEYELGRSDFSTDYTHFNKWGANKVASWIAEEMQYEDCGLRYRVNPDTFWDFPENVITAETLAAQNENK